MRLVSIRLWNTRREWTYKREVVTAVTEEAMGRATGLGWSRDGDTKSTRQPCRRDCEGRCPIGDPDRVVPVAALPLAGTGKIDKDRLRVDYAKNELTSGAPIA